MKNPFEEIYRKNTWSGGGSGYGSSPAFTRPYREWLAHFLSIVDPCTIIDFGCGDWQSSQLIDWGAHRQYLGYDAVPAVIQANQRLYGKANVRFQLVKVDFSDIPDFQADVLIVKDVLQHWPLNMIQHFLTLPWQVEYALFINDTSCPDVTRRVNADCGLGGYQLRDLSLPPFGLPVRNVFSWESPDDPVKCPGRKTVQLWRRRRRPAVAAPR